MVETLFMRDLRARLSPLVAAHFVRVADAVCLLGSSAGHAGDLATAIKGARRPRTIPAVVWRSFIEELDLEPNGCALLENLFALTQLDRTSVTAVLYGAEAGTTIARS